MEEFFTGVRQTGLRQDELLTEIRIPPATPISTCSFQKVTRTAVDIALVNVAVRLTIDEQNRCSDARIVLGAVAPTVFRSVAAEQLLVGRPISSLAGDQLTKAGEWAAADAQPISDVRTAAAYRRHVAKIIVKRSLVEALRRLKEME
jgi:CO/xanthine dehydrogenase FAD-binding subunit